MTAQSCAEKQMVDTLPKRYKLCVTGLTVHIVENCDTKSAQRRFPELDRPVYSVKTQTLVLCRSANITGEGLEKQTLLLTLKTHEEVNL